MPTPDDRYQVTEIWGWPITWATTGSGNKATPSYSVIDTADAHREVGSFYSEKGYACRVNERKAHHLARQLNRAERDHEAQYADSVFKTGNRR